MRFGWAAYIVPFLFVYSPAILMKGDIADIFILTATSVAGIWLICSAMTGYFVRVLRLPLRIAFAAAGVLLMLPHQVSTAMLWINVAGGAAGMALIGYELSLSRRRALLS